LKGVKFAICVVKAETPFTNLKATMERQNLGETLDLLTSPGYATNQKHFGFKIGSKLESV